MLLILHDDKWAVFSYTILSEMSYGVKIIGLSGTNGSGKDTVGRLLAERHKYLFISVTDLLRDELKKRGLPEERQNMRALSTEWRREFGLSVLIDRAVETFKQTGDHYNGLVMASLRNPYEADRVHDLGGCVVWVDADPKVRYERLQANHRGRLDDDKTYEQFIAEEQAEMHSNGDNAALDMSAVKDRADTCILNDTADMSVLEAEIEQMLGL